MITPGKMVLKGVNWVHNDKIRSNGSYILVSGIRPFLYS